MAMFQYRLNKENIKPTKKRLKIATCPSTPGIILHSVLLSYHQFLAFPSRSLLSESRARAHFARSCVPRGVLAHKKRS